MGVIIGLLLILFHFIMSEVNDTGAAWKKFQAPPNMIAQEMALDEIRLTPEQHAAELLKIYQDKYRALIEANDTAGALFWKQLIVREENKAIVHGVDAAFRKDFLLWCRGESVNNAVVIAEKIPGTNEYKRREGTPWGTESLRNLPGVSEFMGQPIVHRSEVINFLTLLKSRYPWNLESAYFYYKYLVRGMGIDDDTCKEYSEYEQFLYPPPVGDGAFELPADPTGQPDPFLAYMGGEVVDDMHAGYYTFADVIDAVDNESLRAQMDTFVGGILRGPYKDMPGYMRRVLSPSARASVLSVMDAAGYAKEAENAYGPDMPYDDDVYDNGGYDDDDGDARQDNWDNWGANDFVYNPDAVPRDFVDNPDAVPNDYVNNPGIETTERKKEGMGDLMHIPPHNVTQGYDKTALDMTPETQAAWNAGMVWAANEIGDDLYDPLEVNPVPDNNFPNAGPIRPEEPRRYNMEPLQPALDVAAGDVTEAVADVVEDVTEDVVEEVEDAIEAVVEEVEDAIEAVVEEVEEIPVDVPEVVKQKKKKDRIHLGPNDIYDPKIALTVNGYKQTRTSVSYNSREGVIIRRSLAAARAGMDASVRTAMRSLGDITHINWYDVLAAPGSANLVINNDINNPVVPNLARIKLSAVGEYANIVNDLSISQVLDMPKVIMEVVCSDKYTWDINKVKETLYATRYGGYEGRSRLLGDLRVEPKKTLDAAKTFKRARDIETRLSEEALEKRQNIDMKRAALIAKGKGGVNRALSPMQAMILATMQQSLITTSNPKRMKKYGTVKYEDMETPLKNGLRQAALKGIKRTHDKQLIYKGEEEGHFTEKFYKGEKMKHVLTALNDKRYRDRVKHVGKEYEQFLARKTRFQQEYVIPAIIDEVKRSKRKLKLDE